MSAHWLHPKGYVAPVTDAHGFVGYIGMGFRRCKRGKHSFWAVFAGVLLMNSPVELNGVLVYPSALSHDDQVAMTDDLRLLARQAPFRHYQTPGGRKMSVRMTAAGDCGWFTDKRGYQYIDNQPDGRAWPDIPVCVLEVWDRFSGVSQQPDTCLVNFYGEQARMGMHQDRDENDFSMPVVSISLGDEALFRVGGLKRSDPTRSIWLKSGDVAVLAGEARLAYHGIDRIRHKSSALLPDGGRINLTLRVAR